MFTIAANCIKVDATILVPQLWIRTGLTIAMILLVFSLSAQVVHINNAPKGIKKLYHKSEVLISKNKVSKALSLLNKAIKKEANFIDAYLKKGVLYYEGANYTKAIKNFEKAIELDGDYDIRVWQALSVCFEKIDNHTKALYYLEEYAKKATAPKEKDKLKVQEKVSSLKFIVDLKSNPVSFDPVLLPSQINTENQSEYLPSLTADGNYLFFTRVTNNQEDLYFSKKDSSGNWSESQLMPNINTHENEGAHCISADGKTILFTSCTDGRNGSAYGCNIYIAINRNGKWSNPKFFSAINSSAWDTQPNISSDGKTIIFTSSRKGGYGGSDLWKSVRNDKGQWSKPKNLGSTINTKGNEASPFLHPDRETLFFMSDGHPSMGSFDLFRSKWNKDETWTKPENIGYPINTEDKEGALVVALDGTTAYYSRGNGKIGFDQTQSDIYTFELPRTARANPVGFVKITVKDRITITSLLSKVEIQSNKDGINKVEFYETDEEGSILVTLPLGKNYSLNVEKTNYYFYSERFELNEAQSAQRAFEIEVFLDPIVEMVEEESEPIILKNVLFETASFELKEESFFELQQLLTLLEQNPKMKIEVRGHTDDVGDDADNLSLSINRAKAVYEYLTTGGIAGDRITYQGYGEQNPIDTNTTEEGRKNNRRTEFVIIK